MKGGLRYACTFVENPVVQTERHFCVESSTATSLEPWLSIALAIHVIVSLIASSYFSYKWVPCASHVLHRHLLALLILLICFMWVCVLIGTITIYATFSASYGQNSYNWSFLERRCTNGSQYTSLDCTENVDENVAQCAQCNATAIHEQVAEYKRAHAETKGMCQWNQINA